jgi:hypothetical protein
MIATSLILLSLLVSAPSHPARADALTGQPVDDPKDLLPAPAARTTSAPPVGDSLFVPMPVWARGATMPPLPDQLKPMGKKSVVALAPVPAPVTPPKNFSATSTTNGTETTTAAAKPSENSPAMITVSPFLQWIKANPQAAAAQARQQANSYHAGPSSPTAAASAPDDTFWLPPLIDSADIGTPAVVGSAAIYSTPQR